MRSLWRGLLAALLLCAASSHAHAAWHEAKSKHFIIYSDDEPARLRDFATRLEKFDRAVRVASGMDDPPVGDGNRLTVFVLSDGAAVRKLIGDRSGFVLGFYFGQASGSVAYVPRRSGDGSKWDLDAETVFFHEYAHHLMMQRLDKPYPQWLVEGYAEFLATARFEEDGGVGLGAAPTHRAWGLFHGDSLKLEALLGASYSKISVEERESIYGRGWLLTHYLFFEPSRKGQLDRYITAIANGVVPLEAARQAFGDLKQLDRELGRYVKQRRLSYVRVSAQQVPTGAIEVKPLTAGAAQVVLLRARSKAGVNDKTAEPLASDVRKVQARFPGDELVEVTLAEAEFDAGNYHAAEAAADRALKVNPRNTEALIYKARVAVERAAEAEQGRAVMFGAARDLFIAANKIDPEDPEPLMGFYRSFIREGVQPTANAIEALHYASNLAPQDLEVRMNSAVAYLQTGKIEEARRTLAPVAYAPHGGEIAAVAQRMMEKINAGENEAAVEAAFAPAPNAP